MERKIRVLFLPKWYPTPLDPMEGLFIRYQAEALTPFCDVAVISVHPDPECAGTFGVAFSEENEVRVLRVSYRPGEQSWSFLRNVTDYMRLYRANMKAVRSIRKFAPDIVHAHILTRMGWIGWRVSRKLNAPLVISEHWSRYFPANGTYKGIFRKWLTSFIVRKASAVVAVSGPLKEAMLRCGLKNPVFRVIPNVVDTSVFRPRETDKSRGIKTLVHISCFEDKSKNISGFLRSIKALSGLRKDFRCLMVGDGPDRDDLEAYAASLGILDSFVTFTGLKTGEELVNILQDADFSVLSSRYETFGTVVIESLACGVPVVSTRVGVALEVIGETNGLLVPPDDEKALTEALNRMADCCRDFDRMAIHHDLPGSFTPGSVGKQLFKLYQDLIGV